MIYIPDLFSAYAKGQEEAIDRNWNDLNQYESVEQARTNNDMARINLQAGMDDYGNNRAVSNAVGTQAMIGEDLLNRTYPGSAAQAEVGSMTALSQYNALAQKGPELDRYYNSILENTLGGGTYNAEVGIAQTAVNTGNIGRDIGLYSQASDAKALITGDNIAASRPANQQVIRNNTAAQDLNYDNYLLGGEQTRNNREILPETFALQKLTLAQQVDQIKQLPVQQQQVEKQRVVETLNMLRGRIAQAASQISYLKQQAQMNPANASPINSEILRIRAGIATDTQTIQQTEAAMGTMTQNTVQSLMGN